MTLNSIYILHYVVIRIFATFQAPELAGGSLVARLAREFAVLLAVAIAAHVATRPGAAAAAGWVALV